jgi:hypothetical protein
MKLYILKTGHTTHGTSKGGENGFTDSNRDGRMVLPYPHPKLNFISS